MDKKETKIDPAELSAKSDKNLARGNKHLAGGDIKRALNYFLHAAKGFEIRKEQQLEGTAFEGVADAYRQLGSNRQALQAASRALECFRGVKDHEGQGRQLLRMASIYKENERLRKALECYRRAMEIHKLLDAKALELEDLVNLASLYDQLGNRDSSFKCLERISELGPELGDDEKCAAALFSGALVYRSQEDTEKAAAMLERVKEIAERSEDIALVGRCDSELAALRGEEEVVEIGEEAIIEVTDEAIEVVEDDEVLEEDLPPLDFDAGEDDMAEAQVSEIAKPAEGKAGKEEHVETPPLPGTPLWEYKQLLDRGRMHRVTTEELDASGANGWELLAVFIMGTITAPETIYQMKRQRGFVPETQETEADEKSEETQPPEESSENEPVEEEVELEEDAPES